jgi:ATP-dependent Lon protease
MLKAPLMFLRDSILVQGSEISLSIGRKDSISAILHAIDKFDGRLAIISQKKGQNPNPSKDEVYSLGTLCQVLKHVSFSDGSMKIMLRGLSSFKVGTIFAANNICMVEGNVFSWPTSRHTLDKNKKEELLSLLVRYNPNYIKDEVLNLSEVDLLDIFVLYTSQIISHPYTGVQRQEESDRLLHDLDYWKQLDENKLEDMNRRIAARIPLLSEISSSEKLELIKEILIQETI